MQPSRVRPFIVGIITHLTKKEHARPRTGNTTIYSKELRQKQALNWKAQPRSWKLIPFFDASDHSGTGYLLQMSWGCLKRRPVLSQGAVGSLWRQFCQRAGDVKSRNTTCGTNCGQPVSKKAHSFTQVAKRAGRCVLQMKTVDAPDLWQRMGQTGADILTEVVNGCTRLRRPKCQAINYIYLHGGRQWLVGGWYVFL